MAPNGPANPHRPTLDIGLVVMGNTTANGRDLLEHPLTSCRIVLSFKATRLQHLVGLKSRCAVALSVRDRNVSRAGVWGLAGPLGAMDGAHEPTRTYLRRVPRAPTHPTQPAKAE